MFVDLLKKITWPLLVSEIMFAILFEMAALLAMSLLSPEPTLLLLGLISVGILIFWLLRLFTDKLWQLLLPSLALTVAPLLISSLSVWLRAILCAAMLLLAMRTLSIRLRPPLAENESPPFVNTIMALGWLLLLNVLAAWQNLNNLVPIIFYNGIIYLLLSVFRRHQIALQTRLARFVSQQTQPTSRIRRFNHLLLLIFIVIMTIVLLTAPLLHLDAVIPWLASIILLGLKKLILWLQSLGGPGEEPGPTTETMPEPTETGGLPPVPGEPAAWLVFLQQVFYYLILAASATVVLAVIVSIIYAIYRKFYENRASGPDVLEVMMPKFAADLRQNIRRSQQRLTRQFGRSPEQKIRRYYYRLIDDLIRKGLEVTNGDTPRDFIEKSESSRQPVFIELTLLYEKARYSHNICTIEDSRRMLDLCRQYRQKQEST